MKLTLRNDINKKTLKVSQLFDPVSTISQYFNKNRSISDPSCCMLSLVNFSNKIDNILESSGQKTTQKQPKMTVSARTKIFENLKLENHRSNINKTYPICVPR